MIKSSKFYAKCILFLRLFSYIFLNRSLMFYTCNSVSWFKIINPLPWYATVNAKSKTLKKKVKMSHEANLFFFFVLCLLFA